jgi:hypothetical protein
VITVTESLITGVLIGGTWLNVRDVTVDWAEYQTPGPLRFARGMHLQATIRTGPNSGDRVVAALERVEAVRFTV